MVDEAKASSSKNYTCIMAGAYTKALLHEHVSVIRQVLIRYPLFVAKRLHRTQRRSNKRKGIVQRRVPSLSTTELQKVHSAWKKPVNEEFLATLVTNTPFPHPLLRFRFRSHCLTQTESIPAHVASPSTTLPLHSIHCTP